MIKKIIPFIFIAVLVSGCNQTPYFTENICFYNANENNVTDIEGRLFIDDLVGIGNIETIGEYLCLFMINNDTLFNVYSTDGSYLTSFGIKGQGPNDFISNRPNGVREMENGQACLWINDIGSASLKRLNLTLSVEKGCTVDRIIPTRPMSINAFYTQDGSTILEAMTPDNFELVINKGKKEVYKDTLYQIDMKPSFSYYKSIMRISPDCSILVSAMNTINLVNILNLNTHERLSLCVGKYTDIDNIVDKKTRLEKRTFYTDLKVTSNYIYALYMNQDYKDSYQKEKPVEIHMFDMQGNFIRLLNIPQYLKNFCISEDESTIYGLLNDHSVYVYDISGLK